MFRSVSDVMFVDVISDIDVCWCERRSKSLSKPLMNSSGDPVERKTKDAIDANASLV